MAQRIVFYGVTGSGKSTIARQLGERWNVPVHHVDDICHEDGGSWTLRAREDMRERIGAIVAGDSWILDGGYATWLDLALERADLVICLDYARVLTFGRLLRRTVRLCRSGELICNGNRQTWRNTLTRNSILIWHCQSFARKRARMRGWSGSPQTFQVVRFTTPAEAARWLLDSEKPADRH